MKHLSRYIQKALRELEIDAEVEVEDNVKENYILIILSYNEDDEKEIEYFLSGAVLGGAPLDLTYVKSYDIDDDGSRISEYIITRI